MQPQVLSQASGFQGVLQSKWYLAQLTEQLQITYTTKLTETSMSALRMQVQVPSIITSPTQEQIPKPIGTWYSGKYTSSLKNAWFTDGSATTDNNTVKWKAAA